MTVAQVLGHVHDLAGAFRDAATKGESPAASSPPDQAASVLPEDWREAIPLRLAELVRAWQDPLPPPAQNAT